MPAHSEKQRRYMAMRYAEGNPPKGMSMEQTHDFMHKPKGGYKKKKRRRKRGAVQGLMGA